MIKFRYYYPRLPEEYGCYWFRLADKSEVWGMYDSFPYPHTDHLRVVDLEGERFYYLESSRVEGYWCDRRQEGENNG
jgi:hypothetical protein